VYEERVNHCQSNVIDLHEKKGFCAIEARVNRSGGDVHMGGRFLSSQPSHTLGTDSSNIVWFGFGNCFTPTDTEAY
jgi:hypothetical protein